MLSPLKNLFYAVERQCLRLKRRKDVLAVLHNSTMYIHARKRLMALSRDPRIRLWVYFPSPERFEPGRSDLILNELGARAISYRIAEWLRWDLIVYPDHGPYFRKQCRKIMVSHGVNMGTPKLRTDDYVFGSKGRYEDGTFIYDRYCSANTRVLELVRERFPDLAGIVKVVGDEVADTILELLPERDALKRKHGLDPDRKTIGVISTWGPHCLLQSLGESMFAPVERLLRHYNVFMLGHPNNFVVSGGGDPKWLKVTDELARRGVVFSNDAFAAPELLATADTIVIDYTSMLCYSLLLDRPIVYFENPNLRRRGIGVLSLIREHLHRIDSMETIEQDIETANAAFRPGQYGSISAQVTEHLGQCSPRTLEVMYELLNLDRHPQPQPQTSIAPS